jgi:hypothetical protein
MLNKVARFVLSLTSTAPVFLVLSFMMFFEDKLMTGIFLVAISVFLFLLCVSIVHKIAGVLEKSSFEVNEAEASDQSNIAFILLFLSPLLNGIDGLHWDYMMITVVICTVTIFDGYVFHYNPVMRLLGWHYYKVKPKEGLMCVLITKKKLNKNNMTLDVRQLYDYMLINYEE